MNKKLMNTGKRADSIVKRNAATFKEQAAAKKNSPTSMP
jgi:hypothetical protein